MKLFNFKFISTSLIVSSAIYLNYRDDTRYLLGGIIRGFRCLNTGILILVKYYSTGLCDESHYFAGEQLFKCFKQNGGCYIKLGQIICQLEHIIPKPYTESLEPLCQECPISDIQTIRKFLEKNYNRPLDQVFKIFEDEPLGSASLAQVHKGYLHDGTPVAIKVQHPYIQYHCPGDIAVVKLGCSAAEFFFPEFKYKWLGKEFETNIPNEIDFRNEGRNAEKIAHLLKDDDRIVVPKIYWEYTTPTVLVMSFEDGKSITNMNYIKQNNISIKEVVKILTDSFNKQIFELGFIHSDPHPGNLFIRKEKINGKDKTKLILLDHGLYRILDDSFRLNYCLLWKGIITQNKNDLRESCNNLNIKQIELFISILTSNTYNQIMNQEKKYGSDRHIGIQKTQEEKERLKKYAAIYHKEITHVLNDVRHEMLLLFKINEFIRNIDRKMGNPFNGIENMMKYIYQELNKNVSLWEKMKSYFEYYKYVFLFFLFRIVNNINFLKKSKSQENIFEFKH